MIHISRQLWALSALAVVWCTGATALGAPRGLTPEGVLYHRFAAAVNGIEATWVNPAGLGSYRVATTIVLYDWRDPGFGDDRGLALSARSLGFSYRKIDGATAEDYSEYNFAFGHAGQRGISAGLAYRYVKSGAAEFRKRHFWNVGLLYRNDPRWSVGAVFENLNKSRVDGERSAVEQRYGLSMRPLGTPQLTLNAEVALSHKQNLKAGEFRFGVEGSPAPGLFLYSMYSENEDFQLGVRVNFTRTFIGAQSRHDSDGDIRSGAAFVGAVAEPQESIIRPPARALRLGVAGRIEENPTQPVFGRRKIAFLDYVLALRRAATDHSVGKVYLTLGANSLSWAQAQEIRSALVQLSALGKEVTVYLAEPSNRNFFLACSGDNIVLAPVGYLGLTGLYAELTFVGGTLEKLGVKVESERIGEHKTAPEFFTNREPSEANKEYVNRLLDELYDQFVTAIATGRKLSPELVRELIDSGPLTSREAREAGLVDVLAYPDEVKKKVPDLNLPVVSLRDYLSEEPFTDDWIKPPVVAVVVAEGEIRKGPADGAPLAEGSISAAGVRRGFSQARATPGVRGIAFRVNSPGGSALESDLIYRQADLARERLPLNVSLGGVAASGGYYIAAPGRRVFASPATITGSIGIYALKPDLSGLYEKIELGKYRAWRGENAGMFSLSKPFSDSERERLSSGLQAFYQRFIQVVGENRGLAVDSVDALGRGRVWTGREARHVGLVDTLGGLWEAIATTAADAGLEEFEVRLYPQKRTLISFDFGALTNPFAAAFSLFGGDREPLALEALAESALAGEHSADYFMRLPFDLSIE